EEVKHIDLFCSGNIIKNVKAVTVPNSGGQKGMQVAAILGAIGGDSDKKLEVLTSVTDEDREKCRSLVDTGFCIVKFVENVPKLYIRVE
ncbi:serine dehydratase subunit alpha family protein, partial [Listeria monocytogenes]|nr:serine dehydratase subunit alpha family protein [Listeria monocytogenes]